MSTTIPCGYCGRPVSARGACRCGHETNMEQTSIGALSGINDQGQHARDCRKCEKESWRNLDFRDTRNTPNRIP